MIDVLLVTRLFAVGLMVVSAGVTWFSIRRSQHHFYSDTPWLIPLGIFVWGDGLVLGPFWLLSGLAFLFLDPLSIFRYILVFFSLRAAYEVIYWINHQVAHKDYCPPLFRRVKWLGSQEAAILYQLLNMCQVVVTVSVLFLTFTW